MSSSLATGICEGIKLAYDGTILDWAEAHVKFPNSDRASRFDRTVAPWMNDVLLAVTDDEATQVFLRASTGAGKCLGLGTPVLMFDGTIKPVQQIQVGDQLMGPDSKPRKVLSLARGREEMFGVIPIKGDRYTVNRSHILSLRMTGNKTKTISGRKYRKNQIENISIADYLKESKTYKHCMKGWRSGVEFESCADLHWSLPSYILGVWLGDGSSAGTKWFGIDQEVWQELEEHAFSCGMNYRLIQRGDSCPEITITNINGSGKGHKNPILDSLRQLNLINNKHIPLKYKTASKKDRLDLLAGLIDTDGSISHSGFDYISKIESLADDVCFVARSVGLAAYKSPCKKKCTNNGVVGEYFRVSISGDCDMVPCRISRKKASPRQQPKNVLNVGIRVESIGEGDYYGFQIDGDGLFMLGDFTVTHNTTMMETLACFIVAQKPGPTLFVGQTDDMVKDWTESRLLPIFRDCEPVRALFPEDRHALRKTTIFFPHMVLFAGGANMTNLQEKSMRYCIGDEVWRWKDGMIKELKARHHDRWNRKTFLCSQGGSSTDEMEHEWDSGTREVWGWTCPQCSTWQRYTFDAIKFEQPKNAAGEMLWDQVQDSVYMECEHCKAQYRDTAATRRNLSNTATFRSLNPNPVRGHRSFEVPAYAVWWIPWFSIVKEWIEANDAKSNGNLEPLKQFIQKRKAQTWQEEIISDLPEITAGDYAKSEFIDGQKIDGEHRRFLCVDKQKNHFWFVIRAFRMDGSSMLLAEGKILTWETIESLALQYNIPGRAVVIDAGYDTPLVYERCARNGWTASHGSGQDGFSHTESNGRRVKKFVSKIETAVAGSDNLRAFYFFHSNEKIKDKLAAMRQPDAVPKWETPRDASNDYRAQMVAEMKKDIVNSKTKQVETRWVRIGGRPNHLFDCECIALASAMLAGVLPIGSES